MQVGASARSDSASSSWSAAVENNAQSKIDTLNNKAKQDESAIPSISEVESLPKGFVRCWTKGCGTVERSYKLMEHHVRCTDTNEFVQTCWRCVLMREDTLTNEMKARAFIVESSPDWAVTHFRMWFVCRGKTGDWVNIAEPGEEPLMGFDQCRRIISSKYWDTLQEDPFARRGQRWMCSCGTFYRSAFGVICEMKVRGVEGVQVTKFVNCEFPSDHVQDMLAMFYMDNCKPTWPEDLYDKVTAYIIKPYNLEKREYTISHKHDQQLPVWDWNQMFSFCGISPLQEGEEGRLKLWAEEAEKNAQAQAINDAARMPKAARTGNW